MKNRTYIKLWSTGPDKYKEITTAQAIDGYTKYLKAYAPTKKKFYSFGKNSLRKAKTFSEWLDTEI